MILGLFYLPLCTIILTSLWTLRIYIVLLRMCRTRIRHIKLKARILVYLVWCCMNIVSTFMLLHNSLYASYASCILYTISTIIYYIKT